MNSPKMSIAMATLVLGLLTAPCPTIVSTKTRRSSCPDRCDGIPIAYPFGIGAECSLPGFNHTCAKGANNTSNLLLGNPSIQAWDLDWGRGSGIRFLPSTQTSATL